jgi:2-polyprenyl-6-methoxyphenol hydroxylase-like FAD-dependent oxidoreductase
VSRVPNTTPGRFHEHKNEKLRALGVGKAGAVVRRWGFCDQQGEVLCGTDLEEMWGEVGPCVGIERPRLQQVLVAGAAAVPCQLGTAVTSLTQDEHRVSVGFSDGEARDYDLVVGADGIYSTVRRLTMGSVLPGYIRNFHRKIRKSIAGKCSYKTHQ